PALAGPGLRHAHPARALRVELAVAVPVELQLDAAVRVGVQLLARRAGDHRGLRPDDLRLARAAGRAELLAGAQRAEVAAQLRGLPRQPMARFMHRLLDL